MFLKALTKKRDNQIKEGFKNEQQQEAQAHHANKTANPKPKAKGGMFSNMAKFASRPKRRPPDPTKMLRTSELPPKPLEVIGGEEEFRQNYKGFFDIFL